MELQWYLPLGPFYRWYSCTEKDWIILNIILPFISQSISFSYWHPHSTEKTKTIWFPLPNISTGIWEQRKLKTKPKWWLLLAPSSCLCLFCSLLLQSLKLQFQQLLVASWPTMKFQVLLKMLNQELFSYSQIIDLETKKERNVGSSEWPGCKWSRIVWIYEMLLIFRN